MNRIRHDSTKHLKSNEHKQLCKQGVLYCVDNMAHAHTTAHKVEETAGKLGIRQHLRMINEDAWELDLMPDATEHVPEDGEFLDMLWVDFGAGKRLNEFFTKWWPKLRKGGIAVVHSTVTNEFTRKWLDAMRSREPSSEDSSSSDEDEEKYDIPVNVILGPEDSDDRHIHGSHMHWDFPQCSEGCHRGGRTGLRGGSASRTRGA